MTEKQRYFKFSFLSELVQFFFKEIYLNSLDRVNVFSVFFSRSLWERRARFSSSKVNSFVYLYGQRGNKKICVFTICNASWKLIIVIIQNNTAYFRIDIMGKLLLIENRESKEDINFLLLSGLLIVFTLSGLTIGIEDQKKNNQSEMKQSTHFVCVYIYILF